MCPLQDRTEPHSDSEFDSSDFDTENAVGWNANVEFVRYIKNKKLSPAQIIRKANQVLPLSHVIFEYVKFITVRPSYSGWTHHTHCPFPSHRDKTPSFGYNSADDYFKCYGCGRAGKAVQFLSFITNEAPIDIATRILIQHDGSTENAIVELEESFIEKTDEMMFDFAIYLQQLRSEYKNDSKYLGFINNTQRYFDLYFKRHYLRGSMNPSELEGVFAKLKLNLENYHKAEE